MTDKTMHATYYRSFKNDMRDLPTTMPQIYEAFMTGHFSVQMTESNPFGRNEADKTIENTINRDRKTSGGYIGLSTNYAATQRWVLNYSRRSSYRRTLHDHVYHLYLMKRACAISNQIRRKSSIECNQRS